MKPALPVVTTATSKPVSPMATKTSMNPGGMTGAATLPTISGECKDELEIEICEFLKPQCHSVDVIEKCRKLCGYCGKDIPVTSSAPFTYTPGTVQHVTATPKTTSAAVSGIVTSPGVSGIVTSPGVSGIVTSSGVSGTVTAAMTARPSTGKILVLYYQ